MTTLEKQQEVMDILADKKRVQFHVRIQKPAVQYDDYIVQIDPKDIVKSDDDSCIDVDATFKQAGLDSAEDLQSQARFFLTGIRHAKELVAQGIDVEDHIDKYKKQLVLGVGDTEFDTSWDDDEAQFEDTYQFGKHEQTNFKNQLDELRANYRQAQQEKGGE